MKIYTSTCIFLFLAIAGHPTSMTAVATAVVEKGGGGANNNNKKIDEPHRQRRRRTDNIDPATQFGDNDKNSYTSSVLDQQQEKDSSLSSESSFGYNNNPSFNDSQQGTRNLNTDQVFQFSSSGHACLLAYDIIQCVGYNFYGQLGQSTSDIFGTPVLLNFPSSITAKPIKVVTGYDHTCTLFYDGYVWCNGSNGFGQLGNGGNVNSATLVQVKENSANLANVIDIEAGAYHTCAIKDTGAMYCWGFNNKGQLGMNDIMDGNTNEKKAVKMALSLISTCVITGTETNPSKSATCVGKGFTSENASTTIDLVNDVRKLTAGSHHFCALLVGDTAKCWGANNAGQLGIGSKDLSPRYNTAENVRASSSTPILSNIADINAGYLSTCLVLANGTPMCFGNNRFYQLGIANGGANELYPTALQTAPVSGKMLVSIFVGEQTGHAIYNDDSIYSMGTNYGGTFGDGSTVSSRNVVGDVSGAVTRHMEFSLGTDKPSLSPSSVPSSSPSDSSEAPSSGPSSLPSSSPSIGSDKPSLSPSSVPISTPSDSSEAPSSGPSSLPSSNPSDSSDKPSLSPSSVPSSSPSDSSEAPSSGPSSLPSSSPTDSSDKPSLSPSSVPSSSPSDSSEAPSSGSSSLPSSSPSIGSDKPSLSPSSVPSSSPSDSSEAPSSEPSSLPSSSPSDSSDKPSLSPSSVPSSSPSASSEAPSSGSSSLPSSSPSIGSDKPSLSPSSVPSSSPSDSSEAPSSGSSSLPSSSPSIGSDKPSLSPSSVPSSSPSDSSEAPSSGSSSLPSSNPSDSSDKPSLSPSSVPSSSPSDSSEAPSSGSSSLPSSNPSDSSDKPSLSPSSVPSSSPSDSTDSPSNIPSLQPSSSASLLTSDTPSDQPSSIPSSLPSALPSLSPSDQPSSVPSSKPSDLPSDSASDQPSSIPSSLPSALPSLIHSSEPSDTPSLIHSSEPSDTPSLQPSSSPSLLPSETPSLQPSSGPSSIPSDLPSLSPSSNPSQDPNLLGDENSHITFNDIDFGSTNSVKGIKITYANGETNSSGSVEVKLGDASGTTLAQFSPSGTVSWVDKSNTMLIPFDNTVQLSGVNSLTFTTSETTATILLISYELIDLSERYTPFTTIHAPEVSTCSGVGTGSIAIGYFHNGDYFTYSPIDFGLGANSIQITYAKDIGTGTGTFEIRKGNHETGEIIGTYSPASTGSWGTYATVEIPIKTSYGIDQLTFRGTGTYSYGIMNLKSFQLSPDTAGYICLDPTARTHTASVQAAASAQTGANLVSIRCSAQQNAVASMSITTGTWIGGTDVENEGVWVLPDGSAMTYFNWNAGEPNNAGDEDCIVIGSDGLWLDGPCNSGTVTGPAIFESTFAIADLTCIEYVECQDTVKIVENGAQTTDTRFRNNNLVNQSDTAGTYLSVPGNSISPNNEDNWNVYNLPIGANDDFVMLAKLKVDGTGSAASFFINDLHNFGFDGSSNQIFTHSNSAFYTGFVELNKGTHHDNLFYFKVERKLGIIKFYINDEEVASTANYNVVISRFYWRPWRANLKIYEWTVTSPSNIQTVSPTSSPTSSPTKAPTPAPTASPTSSPPINVALSTNGAIATQSSTYNIVPRGASLAIDGNTNGIFAEGSVTHTNVETAPWWKVKLPREYSISRIVVYSRSDDCCIIRLNNFVLTVMYNNAVVFTYNDNASPALVITTIPIEPNVIGDEVKIQTFNSVALNLAEVVVEASSTFFDGVQLTGYTAGQCIGYDGYKDLFMYACTDGVAQTFTLTSNGLIVWGGLDNMCLLADGLMWPKLRTCDGSNQNQIWTYEDGQFKTAGGTKCLGIFDNSNRLKVGDCATVSSTWYD